MEIFVQGEHKRKFITRNLSPKFSIIPSQFFPPNNIPSFNLVVREVFETPHNEIKCVLSTIESRHGICPKIHGASSVHMTKHL